jgi:choline-sulfatase
MPRFPSRPAGGRFPFVRPARTLPLLAIAAAALLLAGCTRGPIDSLGAVTASAAAAGYNVLLVTIDTARRDRFGCYGDTDAQTPCVDGLAGDGVLFSDAVTSVPLTLPSHTTLMTGLYPPRHDVHDNGIDALGPEPAVLAEVLSRHGYATGAFVGAFVLDERFGLDRGFDTYDFAVDEAGYHPQMTEFNERSADAVADAALAWLDGHAASPGSAPFFAWAHFFDAHHPYRSPLATDPAFADRPYEAEIAYVDRQLQRIVDWLDAHGLRDRTLIVVTADHGESLGEHGEEAHGMFVYDGTLRVPLVMSCPSLFGGPLRCEGAVGLVDVRPTIQDLLGIATDDDMDGQSLLAAIPADRELYIETAGPVRMAGAAALRGLRSRTSKYIEAPEPEYYDLAEDPAERNNRYDERAASLASRQGKLAAWVAAAPAGHVAARTLTTEEAERLHSLGYTMSGSRADDDSLPDPKWLIAAFHDGMRAEQLYAKGKYAEAAALSRDVIADCDGCVNAVRVLAFSQLRMGHPDEAIATLQEAVDRDPDRYLLRSLAQAMIVDGKYDDARDVLDRYGRIAPRDGWVPLLRGDCAAAENRYDQALEYYRRARNIDAWGAGRRAAERIGRIQRLLGKLPAGR